MARETPERRGGGAAMEYGSRSNLKVTKTQLEEYSAASGDLVILMPWVESTTKTLAVSEGTGIFAQKNTAGFGTRAFYKKWNGSSDIEITWDGTVLGCTLTVEVLRKWDEATPIDVAGTVSTFTAATEFTTESITTATNNARQYIFETNATGAGIKEAPSGFALGVNYGPSAAHRERATAGATGTTVVKLPSAVSGCYTSFAIRGKEESGKTVEWKAALKGASKTTAKLEVPTEIKVGEVELEKLSTPWVRTGHKLLFKAKKTAGANAVILYTELMEGATAITGKQSVGTLTTSLVQYEVAIAESDAKKIVNYGYPLSVRFWAYSASGEEVEVEIAELSMELPESSIIELEADLVSISVLGAAFASSSTSFKAALKSTSVLTATMTSGGPTLFQPSRKPPLELDVEVETPNGFFRLAGDDPKAKNRPSGLSFTTQRGDGFGTGGFTLVRPIFKDYPDINLLDTVRFVGHNGDIAYEGRHQSNPRTNDPMQQLNINLVGWMSYTRGRPISPLIIDRRLSIWGPPSTLRQGSLLASSWRLEAEPSVSTAGEAGQPAVRFTWSRLIIGTSGGEMWAYAGGEDIGALLYTFEGISKEAAWTDIAILSTDDQATSTDSTANYEGVPGPTAGELVATKSGRKYALLQTNRVNPATIDPYSGEHRWSYPRLLGTHGLTRHGTVPEEGFYISDILKYILEAYYPKLDPSGILPNEFILTQATYHDSPQAGYDIIQQLNDLVLYETNVWEDRKFHFEPVDYSTYDWVISTEEPGVSVSFQGDSIESFANGVVVTYTDFGGVVRVLYPSEHEDLLDESENNPANRHGENLWTSVTMPWQGLEAEAVQFGHAYLNEFNRPKRPGSYRITGYIHDSGGNLHQGWKVRSSDTLLISNHSSNEARLITATSWDQDSKSLDITVDAPPATLDAITARHALALESRNL